MSEVRFSKKYKFNVISKYGAWDNIESDNISFHDPFIVLRIYTRPFETEEYIIPITQIMFITAKLKEENNGSGPEK